VATGAASRGACQQLGCGVAKLNSREAELTDCRIRVVASAATTTTAVSPSSYCVIKQLLSCTVQSISRSALQHTMNSLRMRCHTPQQLCAPSCSSVPAVCRPARLRVQQCRQAANHQQAVSASKQGRRGAVVAKAVGEMLYDDQCVSLPRDEYLISSMAATACSAVRACEAPRHAYPHCLLHMRR
jgi:hypothetical protein